MILITVIFMLSAALIHTIIYYTYKGIAEYRDSMLFAVLLPAGVMNDPEVQAIQKQYLKNMSKVNWMILISYIPFIALAPWAGIQVTYFIVWMLGLIFGTVRPFRLAFANILSLKQEHEWYVKPQQVINEQLVYDDGDQYWSNGITYHNPNDSTVFVPKRIGIGQSVNTATKTGKVLVYGTMLVLIGTMLAILIVFVRSDMTSPELQFSNNDTIRVEYPGYSYQFSVDDIISVSLVEEYPKAIKRNGMATSKYARGQFRIRDVGAARMYVYKNNPPYIQIQMQDTFIYYNELSPEQTLLVYEKIVTLQ